MPSMDVALHSQIHSFPDPREDPKSGSDPSGVDLDPTSDFWIRYQCCIKNRDFKIMLKQHDSAKN